MTSDYCVVVADSARARFFALEPARVPEVESGPKLVEIKDLVNPEKNLPERKIFSDAGHGFDDHRTQHQMEFERRFAKLVAAETVRTIRECKARRVVLAAQAHMLSFLRREMEGLPKTGVEVKEAASNLAKMSPQEIQEHLARERLVPECRKPSR